MKQAVSYALFGVGLCVLNYTTAVAQDSLYIDPIGNVGIGTSTPTATVDVVATNAMLRVTTTGPTAERVPFSIGNDGKTRFSIVNGTSTWTFDNDSNFFNISKVGTGVNEFRVRDNGDGLFLGDVYAGGVKLTSSRLVKTGFTPVEPEAVLDKLAMLEVSRWHFKKDEEAKQYIGPMAEDFTAVFGVGDGKHIDVTDANGVAYAAIQGLNKMLEQKGERIAMLEAQNARLEERLRALEQAVLLSANANNAVAD